MPKDEEVGVVRIRPRRLDESVRRGVLDAVEQLELLPLIREAVDEYNARREGPSFWAMCVAWLDREAKRFVCPDGERRLLIHLSALWDLREPDLRPGAVRDALLALLGPDGPLCQTSVNKVQGAARRVIRDAAIDGHWHGPNPFEVVPRLKQRKPEYVTLSLKEVRLALPKLRRDRWREAMAMVVLGPRPGEIKGLRRQDVDRDGWFVRWHRSNARDQTKTGRARRVPVPDELVPVLIEALEASTSEFVFPDLVRGGIQRHDVKLSRTLRTALAAADVCASYDYICRRKGCGFRERKGVRSEDLRCPRCEFKLWCNAVAKQLRWYDLRHSAATLHREAGCDPLVVKMALGHAQRDPTDDIYTHLSDDYMRAELNKLKIF